ncbi:OLC1v1008037C1 [Oldenlandia corymbosa var. corymbosa]|uniref:OLC1v1008037C1 n=1 Tax=Oldenlandia corymbosa var. corymbosa TaxID=529605 RepID=A0AAV1DP23_OLDCO|nr:OLC1v1008037C1 [Oldenlandia corymbosa var. corymbosa]
MEISMFSFEEKTLALLLSKHSLSLLLLFLIFTLFMFKRLINHSSNNLPPSPPKLPIIGNLHQIGSIPQRSLKSLAEKFGPLMLLHFGSKPVLVVSSAKAAEYILKTHDKIFANRAKSCFTGRLVYNFRDVSFSPYGEYWRQIRSICVLQLLSHKRIQSFRSVREEEVGLMVEKIRESCLSGSPIRIGNILGTLANNIISRVAVGKRYSGEKVGSTVKDLFEEFCSILGTFNVGDYIPWLGWINHINGMESRVKRVAQEFDEYLENIVEEGIKRQERKKGCKVGEKEDNKEQPTFIDVLLELKQQDSAGHGLDRDSIKAIILATPGLPVAAAPLPLKSSLVLFDGSHHPPSPAFEIQRSTPQSTEEMTPATTGAHRLTPPTNQRRCRSSRRIQDSLSPIELTGSNPGAPHANATRLLPI